MFAGSEPVLDKLERRNGRLLRQRHSLDGSDAIVVCDRTKRLSEFLLL